MNAVDTLAHLIARCNKRKKRKKNNKKAMKNRQWHTSIFNSHLMSGKIKPKNVYLVNHGSHKSAHFPLTHLQIGSVWLHSAAQ